MVNALDAVVGRPRRHVDVAKLYDAYQRTRSVRAAAREVDIPPATAWDRLLLSKQPVSPHDFDLRFANRLPACSKCGPRQVAHATSRSTSCQLMLPQAM